jgi:hypothetical protein
LKRKPPSGDPAIERRRASDRKRYDEKKRCKAEYRKGYYLRTREKRIAASAAWKVQQKAVPILCCRDYGIFVRRVINAIALSAGCKICGYSKYASALDWHHYNSETKRFNLTENPHRYSWTEILDEMDKCCILCANCHRAVTSGHLQV